MTTYTNSNSTLKQININSGYWDGVYDAECGKWPEWENTYVDCCPHPFNADYGKGYWLGRHGAPPPEGAND